MPSGAMQDVRVGAREPLPDNAAFIDDFYDAWNRHDTASCGPILRQAARAPIR
jgi:hypothetical protein